MESKNIIVLGSLIVAITILFFGNNLFGRFYENYNSENDLSIKGNWEEEKANELSIELMKNYEGVYDLGCMNPECEIYHEVINHYWVDMAGKKSFVTIACSKTHDEMGICNSCAAPLSIFEFEKKEIGYKIEAKYINRQTLGMLGVSPKKISVIPIGYDKFGIEIIDEFNWSGGEGIFTQNYIIYCPIGDDLKEVLNIQSEYFILYGYPESELHNWNSKISTIKKGTGYYDFKVRSEGVSKGKKFKTIKSYRFNGVKYEEV